MRKIKITCKTAIQLCAVVILLLLLSVVGISQNVSIGQSYVQVSFNGEIIGNVAVQTDTKEVLLETRRALAMESDGKLCMNYDFTTTEADELFTILMTEEELKAVLSEKLTASILSTKVQGYTVAIDAYRGNFATLEEVEEFLNTVKNSTDENLQFATKIVKEEGHIDGILNAQIVSAEEAAETEKETDGEIAEVIPRENLENRVTAGINSDMLSQVQYAMKNPIDDSYETGLLDMDFIETVEVFENYINVEELSDIATEVKEVTKEKESNKIYVVESGDCLSVIAMDHETTVSSMVMLNEFESANVQINPGDELIIAVPEPDLSLRIKEGEVYEEDYNADPIIIENDSWYTTKQVVLEEGTTGHRERNDIVTYENGYEVDRELAHQTIIVESTPAVIEQGTITPPTYIKPLSGGRFTSGFGYRWGRLHKGVDFGCPVGTTIYASSAGTVISSGYSSGYGYNVVISHPDGRMTRYAHCSSLVARAGQYVEQGETIAYSGNTGRSTGPHLHFEIYVNGTAVNPLQYISY